MGRAELRRTLRGISGGGREAIVASCCRFSASNLFRSSNVTVDRSGPGRLCALFSYVVCWGNSSILSVESETWPASKIQKLGSPGTKREWWETENSHMFPYSSVARKDRVFTTEMWLYDWTTAFSHQPTSCCGTGSGWELERRIWRRRWER